MANYNAVYSGLGAVPIFLVWLYISWIIVLLGAQLAASHQNEQGLRQAMQARQADQEVRETAGGGERRRDHPPLPRRRPAARPSPS